MKAFSTFRRLYNPGAEVPLVNKLGKWLGTESHNDHSIICDTIRIYVQDKKGWRQFKWSGKDECYKDYGQWHDSIQCSHPCDGKTEGQCLFSHHKHKFQQMTLTGVQVTVAKPYTVNIKAETLQACI